MRYISPFARLKLYNQKGDLAYSFEQHELIVGDPTSTADVIDATTKTPENETLMRVKQPINPGGPNELLEKCGLGYLVPDPTKWGNFYESPYVSEVSALTYDSYWMVHAGTVEVDNKVYYPGQIFKLLANSVISNTPSLILSQWFYPGQIKEEASVDYAAEYKRNALWKGDESVDYWHWDEPYVPMNSLNTSDPNYFGWYRK